MTWTGQIPHEEVSFFSSPSDPQIEITPKLLARRVVTFRGRHVETMVRAARLYRVTGDTRYAAWVIGQMDILCRQLPEVGAAAPRTPGPALLANSDRSHQSGEVHRGRSIFGQNGNGRAAAALVDSFFQLEVDVLNTSMLNIHNIATWQRCAVAQVALLFGDETLWRTAIDSPFGLRGQMAEGITSDYLWYEQSLGYNTYVVRAVMSLFTTAGIAGCAWELAPEMATAKT